MQHDVSQAAHGPKTYLDTFFAREDARAGRVTRLSVLEMERHVGRDRFLEEIATRGFTAIQNREQIYVFCNKNSLHLIA